jgi:hypothetical protein
MAQIRWFLAHSKSEGDLLGTWVPVLEKQVLATEGYDVKVTPARVDYQKRARAIGSWDAWCADVAKRRTFRGDPAYHGVIVPDIGETVVGRATYLILMHFMGLGKHVFHWDVLEGGLYTVEDLKILDPEDFLQHAQIVRRS